MPSTSAMSVYACHEYDYHQENFADIVAQVLHVILIIPSCGSSSTSAICALRDMQSTMTLLTLPRPRPREAAAVSFTTLQLAFQTPPPAAALSFCAHCAAPRGMFIAYSKKFAATPHNAPMRRPKRFFNFEVSDVCKYLLKLF